MKKRYATVALIAALAVPLGIAEVEVERLREALSKAGMILNDPGYSPSIRITSTKNTIRAALADEKED